MIYANPWENFFFVQKFGRILVRRVSQFVIPSPKRFHFAYLESPLETEQLKTVYFGVYYILLGVSAKDNKIVTRTLVQTRFCFE